GIIADDREAFAVMKQFIMLQKEKKAGSGNSLITIHETMVFHNQVKKAGRFFFQGRVEVLFAKALADLGNGTFKASVFFFRKNAGFKLGSHGRNYTLIVG